MKASFTSVVITVEIPSYFFSDQIRKDKDGGFLASKDFSDGSVASYTFKEGICVAQHACHGWNTTEWSLEGSDFKLYRGCSSVMGSLVSSSYADGYLTLELIGVTAEGAYYSLTCGQDGVTVEFGEGLVEESQVGQGYTWVEYVLARQEHHNEWCSSSTKPALGKFFPAHNGWEEFDTLTYMGMGKGAKAYA